MREQAFTCTIFRPLVTMSYYPIFLELEKKTALVVGGGRVAQRKIETMLEYGAVIHIVSKDLTDKLKALVEAGDIYHVGTEFTDAQLDKAFLVIAATDDKRLNHEISEKARDKGLLMNAVDQPADCNFIVPSIVKRGDLLIAISTSGKSPAFAKDIRKKLELQFGGEYGAFLALMGRVREEVLAKGFSQDENSRIFNKIVSADVPAALARGDLEAVKSCLTDLLPEGVYIEDILNHI